MPLSARAYLARKGTIELLCELDPEGSRFEELVAEVPISRPTVAKRLAEGQEVSLLEPQPITGERGTSHEYVFTPEGATLRNLLFQTGLVLEYQQYKQARRQFETSRDEFQKTVATDPPNQRDHKDSLHTLLQRNALQDMVEE